MYSHPFGVKIHWLTVPCESASLRSLSCLLTCTFEITFLKHNLHPKVLTEHACQVRLDDWADNVDFIHIFHTNCRLILILSFNQQHRHRLGLDTALTLIGSVTITCRKLFELKKYTKNYLQMENAHQPFLFLPPLKR